MPTRVRRVLLIAGLAILLAPGGALAASSAKSSYERALAREKAATAGARAPKIAELRGLSASFEQVAFRYPTSGYADNALQKAAEIAQRVFERTRQDADRARAVRLYEWLAREYPHSSLARRATASARALSSAAPARSDAPARPAPPRGIAPPRVPAAASVTPAAIVSGDTSPGLGPAEAPAGAPAVVSAPSAPVTEPARPQLLGVRRSVLPELVRVTLEFDNEVTYHQERLDSPARLFFDLKNTSAAAHLRDAVLTWPDDVVRSIRLGRPARNTTRVVLDLDGTRRHSVFTLYNPYRVVVDFERAAGTRVGLQPSTPAPVVSVDASAGTSGDAIPSLVDLDLEPAPATPPVSPKEIDGRDLRLSEEPALTSRQAAPEVTPASARKSSGPPPAVPAAKPAASTASPIEPPARATASTSAPRAPAANADGTFSLSRQLGLGVSRIVIDPGHGGHDPGALGKSLTEAELVLDVALRVEQLLAKHPGVEVVLTRRTDVFVPLDERTAIANRQQADLFLSIHANASRNPKAHGVETYFLNFATTRHAEAVAARENSATGKTMHSLPDIVKAIATNNKLDESRDLAGLVQRSLVKRLSPQNTQLRDLGVKQAPFMVLVGAGMPSVLAEISFVTHPQEGQLLKTTRYRQRIAEALADAVMQYQRSLKAVAPVAEQ